MSLLLLHLAPKLLSRTHTNAGTVPSQLPHHARSRSRSLFYHPCLEIDSDKQVHLPSVHARKFKIEQFYPPTPPRSSSMEVARVLLFLGFHGGALRGALKVALITRRMKAAVLASGTAAMMSSVVRMFARAAPVAASSAGSSSGAVQCMRYERSGFAAGVRVGARTLTKRAPSSRERSPYVAPRGQQTKSAAPSALELKREMEEKAAAKAAAHELEGQEWSGMEKERGTGNVASDAMRQRRRDVRAFYLELVLRYVDEDTHTYCLSRRCTTCMHSRSHFLNSHAIKVLLLSRVQSPFSDEMTYVCVPV